jgi:hypothetical protein
MKYIISVIFVIIASGCSENKATNEVAKIQELFESVKQTQQRINERAMEPTNGMPVTENSIIESSEMLSVKHGDIIDSASVQCEGEHRYKAMRFVVSKGTVFEKIEDDFLYRTSSVEVNGKFEVRQSKSYIGKDLNDAMIHSDSTFTASEKAHIVCAKDYWSELEITVSRDPRGEVVIESSRSDIQSIIDSAVNADKQVRN